MAMTQRDFEAMAEAMATSKQVIEAEMTGLTRENALTALDVAAGELATACARQYRGAYGFNRSKFMAACGFPEE